MSLIIFHFSLSLFIVKIIILMSVASILPNSDAVSFIETNNTNFYNLFQLTIDVSNINDISANNVKYGFSDNNPFNDLNFSQSVTKAGKSGGEINNYIDQSIKMDIQRHVLFEKHKKSVCIVNFGEAKCGFHTCVKDCKKEQSHRDSESVVWHTYFINFLSSVTRSSRTGVWCGYGSVEHQLRELIFG